MQEKVLCLGESSTSVSMSLLPGSFVPILYFFWQTLHTFWQISPRMPRPHFTAPRWCIWFRKVRAGNLISTAAAARRMYVCHVPSSSSTHRAYTHPTSQTRPLRPLAANSSWPLSCRWCTMSYVQCLETQMAANSFDSDFDSDSESDSDSDSGTSHLKLQLSPPYYCICTW